MSFWQDFKALIVKEWSKKPVSETASTTTSTLSALASPAALPTDTASVAPALPNTAATIIPATTAAPTVAAAEPAPTAVPAATAAPVTTEPTATPTETPVPTPTPTPAPRALSVVAADLEAATSDLATTISSEASHFESWLTIKMESLRAMAQSDYTTLVADKKAVVTGLETELATVGTWFSNEVAAIKAKV